LSLLFVQHLIVYQNLTTKHKCGLCGVDIFKYDDELEVYINLDQFVKHKKQYKAEIEEKKWQEDLAKTIYLKQQLLEENIRLNDVQKENLKSLIVIIFSNYLE